MISPVKNNKAEKDFDKKQKTIMSLKSLHIRQSLFYSLWEKDRIMKVSFEHFLYDNFIIESHFHDIILYSDQGNIR